jgi:hypothetical protein
MSETSSYRSPVEAALNLESELQAYDRDKHRRPLLNALKDQFLLNRLVAASQVEDTRNLGIRILYERMDKMSDRMLLKTVTKLAKMGAVDLAAITGGPIPGRSSPMVSIQQAFGLPGGGSQSALGNRTASNPFKDTGMLLEAIEHVSAHFRDKAAHQIEDEESQRS